MNPQEYKIKQVYKDKNTWSNSFGEFQGYTLVLDGVGEPVSMNKKMPVTSEPEVGQTLYGTVEIGTSANGRSYHKFKSEKRPEAPQTSHSYQKSPEQADSIYRSVALQQAVAHFAGTDVNEYVVLGVAYAFYGWLSNPTKAGVEVVPLPSDNDYQEDLARQFDEEGNYEQTN